MSKKQVLGKGFDSLLPTNFDVDSVVDPGEQIKSVTVDDLHPNPDQPRKSFDLAALEELAQSIKRHGVIQPLVVTPIDSGGYRIVAGERRFRASQMAGLKKVPVVVRNHKQLEELEIALVENVQRVDLSPLEQAVSIVRLRDQFSLTPKEIAHKLGKAETTISNIVRLLQLPESAVEALSTNKITEGHARAILSLKSNSRKQEELLNKIIEQKWSVREAEDFVKSERSSTSQTAVSSEVSELVSNLSKDIAQRVSIKEAKNGKGKIVISYSSLRELEQTLRTLH